MMIFRRLVSMVVLLALAACGGGGGDGTGTPFGGGSGGGSGGGGGGTTPNASDLVLVLSSSTISNSGLETVTATATALDASRNAVAAVPVVISVNSEGIVTPAGTVTDTAGLLKATVGIGANTGLRTITVTATSGALVRTAALQVQASTGASGQASLALSISSSTVTANAPATVTATLRNAQNAPIVGRLVLFNSVRSLSTLTADSALTDANGVGTVTVRPLTGGLSGADEIQVTSSVVAASGANTVLNASVGFNVTGATPTISVALSPASTTLRSSASPVDFVATVRNELGALVKDQVVTFSAGSGLVSVSPPSAVTDVNGRASTKVAPVSAATNGAETLRASTTLAGRDLQGSVNVDLIAEVPSVVLTLQPGSTVSATAPVDARATVRLASGAFAPDGTIVSFDSRLNLAAFNPPTARTAGGVATTKVSPRLITSLGADLLRASTTVTGITRTDEVSAQFIGTTSGGTPVLNMLPLSPESSSASLPATVTVVLSDASGAGVPGQVVTFNVVRGLATTNATTALTNTNGQATVRLSPASPTSQGADEITASISYAGASLSATRGFQVQATPVTLVSFDAADKPLSAYGQTTLTLGVSGASFASPVNVSFTSACVNQGKATLSPASLSVTSATTTLQYRDNGCGAILNGQPDQIQAVVTATGASRPLPLNILVPSDSSIAFLTAAPEQIFLRGSGFTESSVVTFEVRDAAGNPLPGRAVEMRLLTGAGGVTMEGRGVESVAPPSPNPFTQVSNALGRVAVRVNSGTLPTPIRINARLRDSIGISTVSSNLSVAIGLPSQLNFSFSQGTKNIEGYNIDGTPNTYQVIAADRNGNAVPVGTSINFITEGGQVEAIKQTVLVAGIARTTANFVSSEPRPVDGRVTVTAYALGEESFVDLNGNNIHDQQIAESFTDTNGNGSYDLGEPFVDLNGNGVRDTLPTPEPFQDLGNIYKDRNFDGEFDPLLDEFVSLNINNTQLCVPPVAPAFAGLLGIYTPILGLDASIPSIRTSSCDSRWSGAGQVYVRRATETVLSTSAARPLWAYIGGPTDGLTDSCTKVKLQTGPLLPAPLMTATPVYARVAGDTWYGGSGGSLDFIVADANPGRAKSQSSWTGPFFNGQRTFNPLADYDLFPRLNPMAAGTTITATTPTTGLKLTDGGGSPVPSTTEAQLASVGYTFDPPVPGATGIIFVTFRSPSGTGTTYGVTVVNGAKPGASCTLLP